MTCYASSRRCRVSGQSRIWRLHFTASGVDYGQTSRTTRSSRERDRTNPSSVEQKLNQPLGQVAVRRSRVRGLSQKCHALFESVIPSRHKTRQDKTFWLKVNNQAMPRKRKPYFSICAGSNSRWRCFSCRVRGALC